MNESHPVRTCLHLVVSATPSVLDDCMQQVSTGDSVVFIDSGVMHATSMVSRKGSPGTTGFYFSTEDLDARGLLPVARKRQYDLVMDSELPGLLRQHLHCLTWK